jgi:hypothetical protein
MRRISKIIVLMLIIALLPAYPIYAENGILTDPVTSEEQTASEDQTAGENQTTADDQTASDESTTAGDQTTSGESTTAEDQTSSGESTTSEDQTAAGESKTAGDQTAAGESTTAGDQTAADNQTTTGSQESAETQTDSGDQATGENQTSADEQTEYNTALSKVLVSILSESEGDGDSGSTIDIIVNIEWIGDARESATVYLCANGERVDNETLYADDWTYTFAGLAKYDSDGNEIEYTVDEESIDGFTTAILGDQKVGFTVKNTQLTSVNVTKKWIGDVGTSATVNLIVDNEVVDSKTLTKDNNWTDSFSGLAKVDDEGNDIEYTVSEDTVEGYTSSITGDATNGFTITNTKQQIDIPVTKVWYGDAGTSATVHLLANGTEVESATLTSDNSWTTTFEDLDVVDSDGNEIEYTLTEDALDGYESSITGDASSGFTVTNTKQIDIPVTKTWVGDAGTSATVHLFANGTEVDSATLTSDNSWTTTFEDLDQVDSSGTEIEYTLTEDSIDGYTSEVSGDASSGFTVTNTKLIDIPVTKTWVGDAGTSATVHLLANGTEVDSATLTSDDSWTTTFEDLPQADSSGTITYTLTEDSIDGYTSEVSGDADSGFTVTNTKYNPTPDPDKISIKVTKEWVGDEGTEVTVHLYANGIEVASTKLNADNYWTYTFTNLNKTDSSGNTIVYSIVEDAIDGYKSEVSGSATSGFTVTNTKQISIQVTKEWVGDEGTSATVHLLADGEEVASETLTANDNWTHTFTNIDQADSDGTKIDYTLTEDPIDGYISEVSGDAASGFTVTNTQKGSISVTKKWVGGEGSSATVHLLADGEEVASTTLTANDNWTHTFTNIDQADSDGTKIDYTLTEDPIEGYISEVSGDAASGFTVTNTQKGSISVTKKWVGGEGTSATVHLLADGKEVESATLTANGNWTHTFTNIDQADSDGTKIDYTLTEDPVDGYTSSISGNQDDGFIVTNTNIKYTENGEDIGNIDDNGNSNNDSEASEISSNGSNSDNSSNNNNKAGTPQTSDSSNIGLNLAALIAAACALICVKLSRRKRM